MSDSEVPLSKVERLALEFGRFANERPVPKHVQSVFLRYFTRGWVSPLVGRRTYIDGVDWLLDLEPDRGIVLVANHRSFFDMYIVMLCLYSLRARWLDHISFPVRANFFYEVPLGMVVNLFIGGYSMYPPLYRDRARAALNKDSLERVVAALQEPGTMIGLHPEGTRGKGDDPYELLPAQPGVGQIVLHAKPIVVPLFINGLPGDSLFEGLKDTYRWNSRRRNPVILAFGRPLDYSEFTRKKPRAALYKRCADKMNAAIAELGERERAIRANCARGDVLDHDSRWLFNYMRERRRH